jgi:hypothetical protein
MFFNTNPFEKRVTEYLADGPSFIDVVSPEPIESFIAPDASRIYDRLVEIVGAPGSGKTTLSKLFQFNNLFTVTRNSNSDAYRLLFDNLARCRATTLDSQPAVIGCRVPLEGEYRDIWELPYPDELKNRLFFSLLQARAILTWLYYIEDAGLDLNRVRVDTKSSSIAAAHNIGGPGGLALRDRAAEVERLVYGVTAALVPPNIDRLPLEATRPYEPFSILRSINVPIDDDQLSSMHPLVMLDDAHSLHPHQLRHLVAWLSRRDVPIARWVLMRFDALSANAVLSTGQGNVKSGGLLPSTLQRDRDEVTVIRMQRDEKRAEDRRRFRSMSRRMCGRYLQLMPVFQKRHIRDITQYLSTTPATLSPKRIQAIWDNNNRLIIEERIDPAVAQDLRKRLELSSERQPDVVAQAFRILLSRYIRRRPQAALLEEFDDEGDSKPLAISSGLFEGAEIQLMHTDDRPFYYGLEKIADASMENAEQFLRLMRDLVRALESNAIRAGKIVKPLTASAQHRILRRAATDAIELWNFPESDRVRMLTDFIADICVRRTLEPNATLGAGPNAVGILEQDFDTIVTREPRLARVLKYAIAYNALHLKRGHKTKGRTWCLVTLGGMVCLKHGLTLTLGGFIDNISLRRIAAVVDDGE